MSKAYGTSFVGALELLNTAGVKTSDIFSAQGKVWEADMQQVSGLIQGYKAMGQGLSELQQDVSVQLVTTSDQYNAMVKLNQSWDTFQALVAAPLTSILTLAQGFATFATDAKAAGASMTGLSSPALALQQQFQTLYGNVETLFDSMRNSEAVTGSGGFTTFVKNAVQALLPLAAGNKAAAAEISQLAQEAGGPATTNLKSLAAWAGNTKDPLLAMYGAAEQATIGASDLSADAQRLTTTLQQDLNPAMASAIFNAHGGQAVFATFADTLAKSGPNAQPTINAAKNVATELLAVSGNSANAKANFVGFAEAMGLSAGQADKLWSQATTHMTGNLKQVRDQLAQTATSTADLAKPGLWGQVEHAFMSIWDIWRAHPVEALISPVLALIPQVRNVLGAAGTDLTNFFTETVPHAAGDVERFFSESIPHAWDLAWADMVAPVMRGFDSVKSFVSSSFDTWWKTHGDAVKAIWSAVWQAMEKPAVQLFDSVRSAATQFWNFISTGPGGTVLKAVWSGFAQQAAIAWHQIEQAAQVGLALMQAVFTGIGHVAQAAWQVALLGLRLMWSSAEAVAKIAWDVIVAIVSVAIDLITGHWATAWSDIKNLGIQVWNALKTLGISAFTDLEHAAYGIWQLIFKPIWGWFNTQFVQPLQHFFTSTLVSWWNSALLLARTAWSSTWTSFNSTVLAPLQHFFTGDIPSWWGSLLKDAKSTWSSVWTSFNSTVLAPLAHFFTGDVPTWWNDFTSAAKKAWSNTWSAFNTDILAPVEKFFTATLPSAMWNSLKSGIDHVIGGLNTVIGWINDVTGIVGVHIGSIPTLAHGGGVPMASGSVPGTGDEDRTHVIAMGGEYMLRKPARMALQAAFGPDFLDGLNHADTWLGSGSRGNAASQRPGGGRYASGGVLGGIGNWLGSVVGDVEKGAEAAWSGISGLAGEVAKFGEKAAFDALWSAAVLPAEKGMEALGTPGAMGAAWLQDVHGGVENYISAQTAKAKASAAANISSAGVSNKSAEAALQSAAAKKGWTGAEWTALFNVEEREAGFSLTATNPSSGAYGMAQFINGPSEYAQYGGNSSTAAGQAVAMVNYIAQRYGDPEAAWAHEQADGWYAAGGPVISAIKSATANVEQREAMALGAYLLSRWNLKESVPKSTEYGPWLIPTSKHKGLTIAQAENPTTAARLMAPYYAKGVTHSTATEWKNAPAAAALYAAVYAANAAGTSFSQPSTAALNDAWAMVTSAVGPAATSPSPGSTSSALARPAGHFSTTTYPGIVDFGWPAVASALLYHFQVLQGSTPVIDAHTPNTYMHGVELLKGNYGWRVAADARPGFRSSPWASGNPFAVSSSGSTTRDGLPGSGMPSGPLVPGPVSVLETAGPTVIDLNSLITGGPAVGAAGTMGFAAGGALADVAGMFGGGLAAGGVVPGLAIPGLSATLQKQLAGAAQGQLPRTMSDAAGDTVGLQVGNLTINNPVAERPSDSITRSSNRLAFMAGRGII